MDENDSLLFAAQSAADDAEEAKAFAAAFASRHDEPAPEPEPDPAPEPEVEVVGSDAAEGEETAAAEVAPASTERLFAGLTEAQLSATLARSAAMQGAVDKMAGRIGNLMQQIETLRAAPAPQQQAAEVKLDKLAESFPELAELLREDLRSFQVAAPQVQPLPTLSQEQVEEMLSTRMAAVQATMREQMEAKVLTIAHPDWSTLIRTDQFSLWRDSVLGKEAGDALMASEDALDISEHLNKFKAWRAAAEAPVPAPKKPSARLANAVLPSTSSAPAPDKADTEESAFMSGFKQEQRTRGYAA